MMKRVAFILYIALSLSLIDAFPQDLIRADATRIGKRIGEMAQFGSLPGGGVNRVAFSDADTEARKYMIGLLKEAGLELRIDAAGNIIAKRKGSGQGLPSICFGSHIDSVPFGGIFDGVAGVIAALECIELLNENGLTTQHPLELIIFTDEEGGLIGSMAINGTLTEKDLERVSNSGKTIRQGISDIGGNPDRIREALRESNEIAAFIELHIEQGATLYNEEVEVAIVEGIVGIETWNVTIIGVANHAGTTPMNLRKDALLAASKLVVSVNEIANSIPGRQVGTVGKLSIEPGASNVIPGKVNLSIELRDLSGEKIQTVFNTISTRIKEIEIETGTKISYEKDHTNISALMDKRVMSFLSISAQELGLNYMFMPSGAGHDAQAMAKIAPTGMIFIPSRNGISHSPEEFSTISDIASGASILFHTIIKLDKNLNR